jgi:hypothetical protein
VKRLGERPGRNREKGRALLCGSLILPPRNCSSRQGSGASMGPKSFLQEIAVLSSSVALYGRAKVSACCFSACAKVLFFWV